MPIIDPFISQKSDIIDPFQSATSAEISPPSLIGGISPTSYTGAFLTGVGTGAKETLSIPERIAYKVNQALARQGIGYVPVEEKPKSWMETPSWAAETFGGITGVTPEAERAAAEAHPIVTGLGQLAEAIPEFMVGGAAVTKGARALGLLSKLSKTGKAVEKIGALEMAGQRIRKATGIPAELLPRVAIEAPTFAAIEGLKHGQPIEGAIMGVAFPVTQIPSKLAYRILAGAGTMGGLTAIEGGTKEDIAYSAALGGLFNTLSKSLQKDLLREMREKPDVKVGDLNAAKSEEFQSALGKMEEATAGAPELTGREIPPISLKGMPEQPISPFAKELQRPAMPDSVKINDITKGEAIDRLVNGDPTVIPHIEEAVGKFGSAAMTDELLNGAIAKAAKDKKLTNFRKVEPDLKIALQGEEARIAARDKALFEQTRTETADERQRRAIGEDLIALAREKRKAEAVKGEGVTKPLTGEKRLYHYTETEIKGDTLKAGSPHEQNYLGDGVYLTEKGQFSGKFEYQAELPKDIKILDLTNDKTYENFRDAISKEIDMPVYRSGQSLYDDLRYTAAYSKNETATNTAIRTAVAKISKGYDAIKSPYFGATPAENSFEMVVKNRDILKTEPAEAPKPTAIEKPLTGELGVSYANLKNISPDTKITVYRATKGGDDINIGQWVTPDKEVAKFYMKDIVGQRGEKQAIIKKLEVNAGDIKLTKAHEAIGVDNEFIYAPEPAPSPKGEKPVAVKGIKDKTLLKEIRDAEKIQGRQKELGGLLKLSRDSLLKEYPNLSIKEISRKLDLPEDVIRQNLGIEAPKPAAIEKPLTGEKAVSKKAVLDIEQNELVDLGNNPVSVNKDGTITLYHRTTPEAAAEIQRTGKFKSLENTNEVFFSTKESGQAEGYGDTIVTIKAKPSDVRLDDVFHDGEIHVSIPEKRLSKSNVVKEPLPTEKGKPQIGSKIYEKASGGEKAQTHTIEKITPSTEAGVEPTVEFKNDKTGDVSETDLSKLIPITKGKGKGGFTTSFLGTQQAYEALASLSKPTYNTAKTYLHDIGGSFYKEGMKYADFAKSMKTALGDLWDKFKQMIGRVYFGVKKAYKESRLGSEKGLAGYDIGEGKPKPEPPKGAVTEPVSPVKEKVQTTYEIINEPVNPSTPDNVKQYIGNAKQQLDGFWNNVKTFFDQFRQIGEYQLPKGMLKQYPEKTRLKIQDYINAKIGKEELADISPEHFRMIDNVKSRQEFEYKRGKERDKEDRIEVLVKRLYDKLKVFPDDVRKNIQSYLGGKLSLQDLPEEARGIAYSIRERTITLGKMAVKAGTLNPKVFEANKGTWVHYIYAKHILGEEPVFKAGGVGMDLGYTIGRMDAVIKDLGDETYQVVSKGGKQYTKAGLTLEEAQKEQVRIQKDVDYKRKELGHIEDAAMSVPIGWGKVLTDMARAERFKQIAEDPNIVWQPSRLKIDGKPITIGDLAEEWQTFRAMVDRGGATPETIARYEKLSTALLEAQEATKQVPEGFVQMPTGKRWGDMSGAFVKKAVYNDLMPLYKSTSQEVGSLYKTIADIEAKGMAWFKVGKVALNPPTAFRNMVSMLLQSALRPEGKMINIIPYYIKSAQEHLNKGRFYTMAKRDGIFTSNFTQGELREILNEFINAQKKGGSFVTILNTIGKLAKYYGKIDDIGKLAIYVESLDSGMSRARATMEAQKWGMDYSVTSPSVKMLRKHVVPFLTYQYKIAPLLLESMKSKPWLLGSLAIAAPLLAQEAVKNMAGITPQEWDKLKKDLPDYMSKNKNYMMLPFKSPEGNWQWVNIEYFLPWGNFMGMARDLKYGDMGEFTRDMGIGNPFLDLLAMAKSASSGRPPIDPFTRQPVYSQLDSPAIQWAKLSAFLWNKWAPSIVGIDIGRTGFGAAQLTMNIGEQDKWGRTITPAQAAGRWFGVNIITTSPQQTMRIKQAKIRELQAERSRLMRDRSITPEQRMGIQRRFIEQVIGVSGKDQEKVIQTKSQSAPLKPVEPDTFKALLKPEHGIKQDKVVQTKINDFLEGKRESIIQAESIPISSGKEIGTGGDVKAQKEVKAYANVNGHWIKIPMKYQEALDTNQSMMDMLKKPFDEIMETFPAQLRKDMKEDFKTFREQGLTKRKAQKKVIEDLRERFEEERKEIEGQIR